METRKLSRARTLALAVSGAWHVDRAAYVKAQKSLLSTILSMTQEERFAWRDLSATLPERPMWPLTEGECSK